MYVSLTFGTDIDTVEDAEDEIYEALAFVINVDVSEIEADSWVYETEEGGFEYKGFYYDLTFTNDIFRSKQKAIYEYGWDFPEEFVTIFNQYMVEVLDRSDLQVSRQRVWPCCSQDENHQLAITPDGYSWEARYASHGTLVGFDQSNYDWYGFCDKDWGWEETQIACKTMGYKWGIYLNGDSGNEYINIKWFSVSCNGDEDSLWDCVYSDTTDDITDPACSNSNKLVHLWCSRYFPNDQFPVRILNNFQNSNNFAPILYGDYGGGEKWSTICMNNNAVGNTDFAEFYCETLGKTGSGSTATDISNTMNITQYISTSMGVTYISYADFSEYDVLFSDSSHSDCIGHANDMYIECVEDVFETCQSHGDWCTADIDCCTETDYYLFCSPVTHACIDRRETEKPDGFSPCYRQSECESGSCSDPGSWGLCQVVDTSAVCGREYTPCFDDSNCCVDDNILCAVGFCMEFDHDSYYNGSYFMSVYPARQTSITTSYEIEGYNLREGMMFKLSDDGSCDDNKPSTNVPHISHFAARGGEPDGYELVKFKFQILNPDGLGQKTLCYAVNDYATYHSTYLSIALPPQSSRGNDVGDPISATVTFLNGASSILYENATLSYIEYELTLSRALESQEYLQFVAMPSSDHAFDGYLYPASPFYYHPDREYGDVLKYVYDETNNNDGYRYQSSSSTPINVRLYWYNNGAPEIMDREFTIIHVADGIIGDYNSVYSLPIASVDFTMIDDDPRIVSKSLRLFGGDSGEDMVQGTRSGDESLQFTCIGCGSDYILIELYYGTTDDPRYYTGENIEITNTFSDNNEISASYIQFDTSYVLSIDDPSQNLTFTIIVHSRLNYTFFVEFTPDFIFSYPADLDTSAPVIDKIEGEGCDNIGKRALNCPTDGKYNDEKAKITLFGTNFPEHLDNTTVEILIDGSDCPNVEWETKEDQYGMRNVSCEFGAGVSSFGEEGYANIQLSYIYDNGTMIFDKSSDSVRYFNYSYPNITQISGCDNQFSDLHTTNCTRVGGGVNRLQIHGTNFGASGSRAFFGGSEAIATVHDADNIHTILWVTYGPGTRLDEKVLIMNQKGGTTNSDAYISYRQCIPGMFQRAFQCIPCLQGQYSNVENADQCFDCAAGTHSSLNGSTSCSPCLPGTFALGEGNSHCSPCPTGTYSPSSGGAECTECSEGQFNALDGSDSCWNCETSSFSNKGERDSCFCDVGYYMYATQQLSEDTVNVLCQECSDGMECTTSGLNYTSVYPLVGWMPMIHTEPASLQMTQCINTACIGGQEKCAQGFTGILCTDCDDGLGKVAGHGCETCLPPASNALRLLGVITLVLFLIVFFIYKTIKSAEVEKSDISTIGKIGFSFLQFNSMALQFDYEWPGIVSTFLKIQEQPATVANGVLSVDCFVKDNNNITVQSLYIKALCYLFLPGFVVLICSIVFCKYKKKNKRSSAFEIDRKMNRKRSSLIELSRMELPAKSLAKLYVDTWNYYITAVIITIFMIHPSIVQTTFGMLNCKQLGAFDDDFYLIDDMTIQCWKTTHTLFVLFVAFPMLIFYVAGMPLFVLWRLYMNRDELKKPFNNINKNILNRYHFLFKGYEPEFYFWEIIIMIRKVSMVAIAVFFAYNVQIQALLATLLVVIALCVHSLACPYVTDAMDGLELLSLFGSFCTYFFGQFLFTPAVGPGGRMFVSFIIVVVNLAMILTVMAMVCGKGAGVAAQVAQRVRTSIFAPNNNLLRNDNQNENENENNTQDTISSRGKKQKIRATNDDYSYYQPENQKDGLVRVESESPIVTNKIKINNNDVEMEEIKEDKNKNKLSSLNDYTYD